MQTSKDIRSMKDVLKDFQERMEKNIEYISDEEDAILQEKEQVRVINEKVANLVPKMYWNAEIDKAITIDSSKSFYIDGEAGRGKTHFLYALVRDYILKDKKPHTIIYFPDICLKYKNAPFSEKEGIINSLKQDNKLVFDDIGAEMKNDSSLELLSSILNYRCENLLFLGFTSNLGIGKLPYDDTRIKSRIAGIIKGNKFTLTSKRDKRL